MGLDAVEMLMEVENVFGITIEDAEAEKMTTPRDLIETVFRKVNHVEASGCLTQRSFQLVRKSLMSRLGLNRAEIAPTVPLATLVAKKSRASLLGELAADFKTGPLPELERAPTLLKGFALVSLGLGVFAGLKLHATALQANDALTNTLAFCFGLGVAVCAQTCAWLATAPLRIQFPPVIGTVGHLALWVTAHKTDLARPTQGGWTREQVAARVREIVISQLGCEKSYREDASFVKELGLS